MKQTGIIAHSNKCRMNQYFPFSFSAHPLRVSSQIGWIHAMAYVRQWFRALREANLFAWFYAIGGWRMEVDKADFPAIAPIGSIDEQA